MVVNVGHRGAAGHEPENTLRGFRRAMELGADMVELDVQICSSGEMVVIHDDTVDRTTNGTGAVDELTFEELRRLDAGGGERIPTLDEVIDVADREIGVNVELKGLGTAGPVHEVIERAISEKGWSQEGFIVSSFHLGELVAIRELSDEVRTGVLFARERGGIVEFAELNRAYSIHPYFGSVDADFIGEAREKGLRMFVWTVNDPADIGDMKALGVDGIISDYPDRI